MATQPAKRLKISYASKDPSFTSSHKAHLLENTDDKDLLYTLVYWDIASVGSTSRDILICGGAKHKFECPVIYVSESMVIDMFLADRFGLLGENKWESLTIQSFYSSIQFFRERTFSEVAGGPKDERKRDRDDFLNFTLKKFLEDHEFHLQENGNSGFYVGNKLSLADLHLHNIIHFFQTLPWGKMAEQVFKQYEAVWKVKENVDKVAQLAAWRASDQFKLFERNSITWYKRLAVPEDDTSAEK